MNQFTRSLAIGLTAIVLAASAAPADAQRMSGEETIGALQGGGYVLACVRRRRASRPHGPLAVEAVSVAAADAVAVHRRRSPRRRRSSP